MALTRFFGGSAARQTPSPDAGPLPDDKSKAGQASTGYDVEGGGGFMTRSRHPMNRLDHARRGSIVSSDPSEAGLSVEKQLAAEEGNAIQYRTCSWQKTAALLFSEYICLAIMSFPWSYSYLGLVPGLLVTVAIAAIVLYTSLICWEFCLRHPEIKDVCDLGQMLFFNNRAAWWFTAVMFLLNNTFIMGFHCLVGAEYLNTVSAKSSHRLCTVAYSAIFAVAQWLFSMPRTFSVLARLATASAFFTFVSVVMAAAFAGAEDHAAGAPAGTKGTWNVWTPYDRTGYVAGMGAFLNISYTFIGQITLPSFIAEMRDPREFPKALWAVTIAEIIVFSVVGAVGYVYIGNEYMQTPLFGALGNRVFQLASFSFMIPTMIFLGVLYASVSARFIMFNLFAGSRHLRENTFVGWLSWGGILAILWVFAFIIAEVIPFFSDLLSLMSSLFDSFFGFIYWGVGYMRMRRVDYGPDWYRIRGVKGWTGFIFNMFIIVLGLYFLGAGTYASVQSIVDGYHGGNFGGPFTCKSNGFDSDSTVIS